MADITMCGTENCKWADTCYRKLAIADSLYQSWSNFDCKEDKEYYWDIHEKLESITLVKADKR